MMPTLAKGHALTASAPEAFVPLAAGFWVKPRPLAVLLLIGFEVIFAFTLDGAALVDELFTKISEVADPSNTSTLFPFVSVVRIAGVPDIIAVRLGASF